MTKSSYGCHDIIPPPPTPVLDTDRRMARRLSNNVSLALLGYRTLKKPYKYFFYLRCTSFFKKDFTKSLYPLIFFKERMII